MLACLEYAKEHKPWAILLENVIHIQHSPEGQTSALQWILQELANCGYSTQHVEADVQVFHKCVTRKRCPLA